MRITILGAGGFIGSHLVEHLLRRDEHEVVGLDLTDEKLNGRRGPGFTFHRADVRLVPALVEELIRGSDVVVDLIAYANPSLYVTAPLEVFDLNFLQNLRIAEACVRHGVRLVQFSSAEVYGKAAAGEAYSEDTTDVVLGPVAKQRWIYATSKLLLERVLYAHGRAGDLAFTIVRPFNFIGPRLDYLVRPGATAGPRVFAHFMSALLGGGPMYLVDGGRAHRTFMHIADACDAFQLMLDRPDDTRNQIYNVGNPANNLTIRELADLMLRLYSDLGGKRSAPMLVEIPGEEFYGEGYEDADRLPPDISKIRHLGWTPTRNLETTFRDAMAYYIDPACTERRNLGRTLDAGVRARTARDQGGRGRQRTAP